MVASEPRNENQKEPVPIHRMGIAPRPISSGCGLRSAMRRRGRAVVMSVAPSEVGTLACLITHRMPAYRHVGW